MWVLIQWYVTGGMCKPQPVFFHSNLQRLKKQTHTHTHTHSASSNFTDPIFTPNWAAFLNAKRPAGWHQLFQSQTPEPVTRPGSRGLPIQSTCHSCQRRDTQKWIPKMQLHIDGGGGDHSQARRGLSPASSLHFLLRERKRDSQGLNWRQRVQAEVYILFSQPLALSKSVILLVTLNVTAGSQTRRPK